MYNQYISMFTVTSVFKKKCFTLPTMPYSIYYIAIITIIIIAIIIIITTITIIMKSTKVQTLSVIWLTFGLKTYLHLMGEHNGIYEN